MVKQERINLENMNTKANNYWKNNLQKKYFAHIKNYKLNKLLAESKF